MDKIRMDSQMPSVPFSHAADTAINVCCPVIFQNNERTISIVDIPTSIAHAQGTLSKPCNAVLLSSEPLQEPYPSTEPKTSKAKEKLINSFRHEHDAEMDTLYADLVHGALEELQLSKVEDWCLPRTVSQRTGTKKRKASPMNNEGTASAGVGANTGHNSKHDITDSCDEEYNLSDIFNRLIDHKAPLLDIRINALEIRYSWDGSFYNDEDTPVRMTIQQTYFTVPAKSTFLLGDCTNPSEFRNMLRAFSSDYGLKRKFDFILLDPPWPNSSVKRKKAYSIGSMLRETKSLLLGMDLDQYVADNGLVGIWITNKPAVRELVLGAGGVFEALNIGLVEEWVWVKTTAKGEPVTAIDGLWRKPYEVLLLGQAPNSRLEVARHGDNVKRRVMFGVPDLHSRKPCLKSLIEEFLPERYQALEVFARYLVSGWWSWGNEVLKFNGDVYWSMNKMKEMETEETDTLVETENN